MSKEYKFAEGMFIKEMEINGQNGTFKTTKLSIEIDTFNEFANGNLIEHNGKHYLNLEIKKSRSGNPFIILDEYKKNSQDLPF